MKRVSATITGLSALLQHSFTNGSANLLPGGTMDGATSKTRTVGVGNEPTPRDVATGYVLRDKEGRFCVPTTAFLRLLREAGGNHKVRGTRRSLKYLVPSAVFLTDETAVICNGNGGPATHFEVDSRPVVIPSTKGRVMCHRPRFEPWSVTVTLDVDDELIAPEMIHDLLAEGGKRIGIGDFRPEKGGPFGRFRVTHFEQIEAD